VLIFVAGLLAGTDYYAQAPLHQSIARDSFAARRNQRPSVIGPSHERVRCAEFDSARLALRKLDHDAFSRYPMPP
jgi:hypothetical protein